MTSIQGSPYNAIDTLGTMSDAVITASSSTEVTYALGDARYRFQGSGFVVSGGSLTAGTITGVHVTLEFLFGNPPTPVVLEFLDLSGLSLAATDLEAALAAERADADPGALEALFGAIPFSVQGSTGADSFLPYTNTEGVALALTGSNEWRLYGGDDSVIGGTGVDLMYGGVGNDSLDGGQGQDTLYAGSGDDVAGGGAASDVLYGGPGVDALSGDGGDDLLYGGGGSGTVASTLSGGDGNDGLWATAGLDGVDGGDGNDSLYGGNSVDTLDGGAGDDTLDGGKGSDVLTGGAGRDTILGYAGNDQAYGGDQSDSIDGGAGSDTLTGGTGSDSLIGGDGADRISGEAGNDALFGGIGADSLDGGDGNDRIRGSDGGDRLVGGDGRDSLQGDADDDLLFGGADVDRLTGGEGRDQLEGGTGADVFIFSSLGDLGLGTQRDIVTDFASGVDTIDLTALGLEDVGTGAFTAAGQVRFDAATARLQIETTGDGVADFHIGLAGVAALGPNDLLV